MSSKKQRLTREELAVQEMDRTTVSPVCRAVLILLFIATLWVVPLVQFAEDWIQFAQGRRTDVVPESVRLKPLWERAYQEFGKAEGTLPVRVAEANRALLQEMGRYETRLEDSSWLPRWVLPNGQVFFTRFFGLGNEKAWCGLDGELFYGPDVHFVTEPGFLNPKQFHRRKLADTGSRVPLSPDPRPTIIQFDRELKSLGIQLIVVPVPAKPTLRAEGLYRRYPATFQLPENPSYDTILDELEEAGVEVFDCREMLAEMKEKSFLKQDTHWQPAAMESVAEKLAERIVSLNLLPEASLTNYTRRRTGVGNGGDIAAMLKLPKRAGLCGLEKVRAAMVLDPSGARWKRSVDADVLLLGDSFTNIFSIPSLNWGASAGFAEQLSFYLKRPLDRISFNDNGSYATRRELARRQAAGARPLDGKKVVVWEFAAREFAQGDWQIHSLLPDTAE